MDLNKMYSCVGKETLQNKEIPTTSGVYFFWTKEALIYIGKAKNLRMRIAQHFGNGFMVLHMINPEEPEFVSFIETEDEFDALHCCINVRGKYDNIFLKTSPRAEGGLKVRYL